MTPTLRHNLLRALLILATFCWSPWIRAQDPAQQGPSTVAELEARLTEIRDDASIAEELKTRLIDAYTRALESLRQAEQNEAAAQRFAEERAGAPALLEETRQRLAELAASPPDSAAVPEDLDLAALEARLTEARQELERIKQEAEALNQEATRRAERRKLLPDLLAKARKDLAEFEAQPPIQEPQPLLATARQAARAAQRRALQSLVASLEAEQSAYENTGELLGLQRDLVQRRLDLATARVNALNERVQQARLQQAQQAQAEAEQRARQAQRRHPALAALAERNAELARQLTDLTQRQARVDTELQQLRDTYSKLQQDFQDIQLRVQQIGLTEAIGALLRSRRAQLPDTGRGFRRAAAADRQAISESQAARFDLDDLRDELSQPGYLEGLLGDLEQQTTPEQAAAIRAEARELLAEQLRTVDELRQAWARHFDQLINLDTTRYRLRALSEQYDNYIKERVLWVRSTVPLWKANWQDGLGGALWFVDPDNWLATADSLVRGLQSAPAWVLAVLLAVVLLLARRRIARHLREAGALAMRGSTVSYRPTLLALLDTALLAASLPALPVIAGAVLASDADAEAFPRALSQGLLITGAFFFALEFVRIMVRDQGLAQCHFRWDTNTLALLRRTTRRLEWVLLPALLIAGTFESHGYTPWRVTVSRLAFSAIMIALALFCWRLLHPRRGLLAQREGFRQALGHRLAGLWFVLAVGAPAALLVMATTGYYFTALQLLQRVEATLALLFAAVFCYAMVMRRLTLSRRILAMRLAKERMQAARQAAGAKDAQAPETAEEQVVIDPGSVALQTRKLLRVTLWIASLLIAYQIWVDVLPALGMFRQWVLWSDASTDPATVITVAHLLGAILLLLATFFAARNIPGILDLLIFQRVKVQQGERNAIATLVRYAIYLVGFLASFSAIGIGWSKVQWLVAAMSVGLGFGLQEIFANFVSGLILLFERPIRPGDLVTVGDVHGRVQKIRIRATTILDWDRKELIVPNKEFVSGRFVNWTLSDSIVRATLPVGVAYGSDTEKARQVLLEVARSHPLVLRDPAPRAVFRRFGDSTLDLELRVFLANYDDFPQVQTELHTMVDRQFRQHGIEIAFPQRDLHLRSAEPLVRILDRRTAAREEAAGMPEGT